MSHIERIDHLKQSEELMLSQFSESPNIQALIKSLLTPVQELEDSLHTFLEYCGISTAYGEMLDIIGSWMGVERQGRLDDEYRTVILGRAIIEGMDGTTEKFLEGFRVLINSDQARFFTYYPNDLYAVAGEGWNSALLDELKKIIPVVCSLHLFATPDLEYQEFGVVGEQDDVLKNQDDVPYDVLIDGILYPLQTTIVESSEVYGTQTTFGWDGIELANEKPWAFEVVPFKIVEGQVVDQDGDLVVDDQGNPISVLEQVVL